MNLETSKNDDQLLWKILAKGGEDVKSYLGQTSEIVQGKVREVVEGGLNRLPLRVQNISTLAGTLGEIFIDFTANSIKSALHQTIPWIFTPEKSATAEPGVEAIKGKKIAVWLVHPTNYRDDGTPRKYKRQILPSNAIGQLSALMPEKILDSRGNEIPIELHFLEDAAQPFDIDAIQESLDGKDVKGMVMLCGVQSNQWPRALNLARLCKERNIPVVAGGYHVRADLPLTRKQAEKIGITLAIGEAEAAVADDGRPFLTAILEDLSDEKLQLEYRQTRNPDIEGTALSDILKSYQKLMITPEMATMETSRGCPLPCSFCTIRTIGGKKVRARTTDQMKGWLREIFEKKEIRKIFITDDNFARNDQRFEILKIFEELRNEGLRYSLMLQVDTMATAGEQGAKFLKACEAAGVYAVFLGIESVDPVTLREMNKPQNHPERYGEMIDAWHKINVFTQCGFIIGNRNDSKGVGKRSAQTLHDMGIDIATANILTPLPGSVDYHNFHEQGVISERDLNRYDSHSAACIEFPGGLTKEEVEKEYRDFYMEFYSLKNLMRLTDRLKGETLRAAIRQWVWSLYSSLRGDHPMFSGLGNLPPDFVRADFPDDSPLSIEELAPQANGPGATGREKNIESF